MPHISAFTNSLFPKETAEAWVAALGQLTTEITPTIITADQNNYAPTGSATATVWRLSSDAIRTITGIGGGTDGRIIVLLNVGSYMIQLEDSSASSLDANKIRTVDFAWSQIPVQGAVVLLYDDTASRWYVITDRPNRALQAALEAGTAYSYVSPASQQWHPSAAKCWGEFDGNSTTILKSYNITSVADTATGQMTVTIATDFSDANWACLVSRAEDDITLVYSATYDAKAAGSVVLSSAVEGGSGSDPSSSSGNASWSMVGFGDQ